MLIGEFRLTVNNKNLGMFTNAFNIEILISKPSYLSSRNYGVDSYKSKLA